MGEENYAMEKAFELSQEDRTLGAFCYGGVLLSAFTGIGGLILPVYIMLSEKKNNPPLRLHAIQSLVNQAGLYVVSTVLGILIATISQYTCFGVLGYPLLGLTALGFIAANLYWAFKTYKGETFTIPYITDFVTKQFKKE